ncbi:hypothetical protein [Flavobacterium luteum]|uniref:Uncharacterized protein n=1 Tax=Flavobacterium luteum TaxID=2026654 RepID=A0A7J5AJA3_9FLAO|nr:hypothetical protein [Flavobacterium luteum]KAB1157573.1 hypothetical protein F6464_00360 [Flavobacterium luteum]
MKTLNKLNADILNITMTIRDEYPELLKYLDEIPVPISEEKNPEISNKILQDYYNSLEMLLKKYAPNHQSVSTKSNN